MVRPSRLVQEERVWTCWAIVLALLTLALLFVPLFDLLGFELSLALGLAVGPAAAHLGARSSSWSGGARRSLALLVAPLLLASLNALRVKNCNYPQGLLFFILLPGAAAVVAAGWGRAARLLLGRPGRALAAVLLLGLGSAGLALHSFLVEPQISFTGAAFGWWPGALYDEALGVPRLLAWSRLSDLAAAATALALAHNIRAVRARRWSAVLLLPLGGATLALAALGLLRGELGYHQDRRSLEHELGGALLTPRIELHYPPASYPDEKLPLLVEDLRYRLDRLEAFFGLPPASEPVKVYVYAARAQRRRLIGADRVSIAKPWLREVHLLKPEPGDPIITHELAHVVAGRCAPGPLHMPVRAFVLPQMGLVEGAAVAAEWDAGLLTPHEWSAAMRRLGLAPDPAAILGPGSFFTKAAARAYTVMGSFVRFLVERYGPAPFCQAYGQGALDGAYPVPPAALLAEWARFVDGLPLGEAEMAQARLRFRQPSIFHRVCAREVARVAAEARRASRQRRHDEAIALHRQVCRHDPGDPGHLLALLEAQAEAGAHEAAQASGEELLGRAGVSEPMQAQVLERLGDLAWLQGQREEARGRYREAARLPLEPAGQRSLAVKLWALGQAELEPVLRSYLLEPEERWGALVGLALRAGELQEGLLDYLVGRALVGQGQPEEGIRALRRALPRLRSDEPAGAGRTWAELPDARLGIAAECLRLLGRAQYLVGRFAEAGESFSSLGRLAPWSGWRAMAEDWEARCRWAADGGSDPAAHPGQE